MGDRLLLGKCLEDLGGDCDFWCPFCRLLGLCCILLPAGDMLLDFLCDLRDLDSLSLNRPGDLLLDLREGDLYALLLIDLSFLNASHSSDKLRDNSEIDLLVTTLAENGLSLGLGIGELGSTLICLYALLLDLVISPLNGTYSSDELELDLLITTLSDNDLSMCSGCWLEPLLYFACSS